MAASNNMARLPKPTHDVLGGCMKSGLFLMCVITYQKARRKCVLADRNISFTQKRKVTKPFRSQQVNADIMVGWRSRSSRNKTDSHWFNLGMLLAGIAFFGGGVGGGEICQGNFNAENQNRKLEKSFWKVWEELKEVQPVMSRKEKPKSENFESAQFEILIYSQCISMCFHRTRPPPPFFLQSAMLLLYN